MDNLRRHWKSICGKAQRTVAYLCSVCQTRFMQMQQLKRHVMDVHLKMAVGDVTVVDVN